MAGKIREFDIFFQSSNSSRFKSEVENGQTGTEMVMVGIKFQCTRCDKQYDHRGSLLRHMQSHTGRFNFYCDKCKKGINDSRDYKLHMEKHAGIQYKCEYCPKSFTLSRTRDYHMSEHSGEWRMLCDVCNKGFNKKPNYHKHMKIHS